MRPMRRGIKAHAHEDVAVAKCDAKCAGGPRRDSAARI